VYSQTAERQKTDTFLRKKKKIFSSIQEFRIMFESKNHSWVGSK